MGVAMKNKLLIIILICFSSINIVATDISIILNGKNKKIQIIEVDENIFVNFEQFFKLFNEKLKFQKKQNKLTYNNISIITYPNSFFILFLNDLDTQIIQLNTPAYEVKDILYVPINSVLSGLKEFFDIKYDLVRKNIFINLDNKLKNYFENEKENNIEVAIITLPIVKQTSNIPKKEIVDLQNVLIDFTESQTKNEHLSLEKEQTAIKPQDIIVNYSLENINKPALSSLSYSDKSFIIDKQERQLFDRTIINNVKIESSSDLPSLLPSNENKALPPFRKYSIPNYIKKEIIEDLK